MAYPKITYGAGPTTLTFTYPPVNKPNTAELNAVRHDSITVAGIRQAMLERIDSLFTLEMAYVPFADLPGWAAFMAWALTGNSFKYYPDAALTAFDTYELVDTNWKPQFAYRQWDKFTFVMRHVPGGAAGS